MTDTKAPMLRPPRTRKAECPITTWLYADQFDRLKALAEQSDISASALIRHAIQRLLDANPNGE